jgi:N-acetylated-alpha-linked acidic dipeptidase
MSAWVMGASDPVSGTVSLHEVIRGFSMLLYHGWKPLRTIVFASWDGEEVCDFRQFYLRMTKGL